MSRREVAFAAVLLSFLAACRDAKLEPHQALPAESFAGAWRSVTPSYEFVRLTIASKSSEQASLGGRLTLSGRALEGSGRIDGDSAVFDMRDAGTSHPTEAFVVRAASPETLQVRFPGATGSRPLSFVRGE